MNDIVDGQAQGYILAYRTSVSGGSVRGAIAGPAAIDTFCNPLHLCKAVRQQTRFEGATKARYQASHQLNVVVGSNTVVTEVGYISVILKMFRIHEAPGEQIFEFGKRRGQWKQTHGRVSRKDDVVFVPRWFQEAKDVEFRRPAESPCRPNVHFAASHNVERMNIFHRLVRNQFANQ